MSAKYGNDYEEFFISRLIKLRIAKGVSARSMSIEIGQGNGYINNIENGKYFPSMQIFFYICQYLGVSPKEFFDDGQSTPGKLRELMDSANELDDVQVEHLTAIAKDLKK